MTLPILLDCDTGIDDSVALLLLLASPDVELVGITCTAGNVGARQVATNNLAWLDLVGAPDIEVALGSEVPVLEPTKSTEQIHGPQGIGYAVLPTPIRPLSDRHATEVWIDAVRRRPGEITGLVTGPLTNLALAVRLDPELPRLLKRLVVMGGAFHYPGNTTPASEWNIAVDPEAARVVIEAFGAAHLPDDRLPLWCGLDVTETVIMLPAHLQRLADRLGDQDASLRPELPAGSRSTARNPVLRHLTDAVRFYFEWHAQRGDGWMVQMHDPFAAAIALDPSLGVQRRTTIDVELGGTLTRGMTLADDRGLWGRPANAMVVERTDVGAFFDLLLGRLGDLAERVEGQG